MTTGVFGLVIGGDENEEDMKKMQNWLVLVCENSTNLSAGGLSSVFVSKIGMFSPTLTDVL